MTAPTTVDPATPPTPPTPADITAPPAVPATPAAPATPPTSKAEDAPVPYEPFTLPEGFTADDPAIATSFIPLARELKLDQAQAQKLLTLYGTQVNAFVASQTEALAQQKENWKTATKADTEVGGVAFEANLAVAKRAIERFGTPALREYLDQTGHGNHPEFIRFAVKVGRAISEDTIPPPGGTAAESRTVEQILYPTMHAKP